MAGMLPGVECARRRRFHQGGWNTYLRGTRHSSFCLYTSSHETHLNSNLRNMTNHQNSQDEKLGSVVREAKERLDEKFKNTLRRSNIKERKKSDESGGVLRPLVDEELKKDKVVFGLKKISTSSLSSKITISGPKYRWKSTNQDECVVCLEKFESGENLIKLPCSHRFHSRCLVPWLETNAHCPCCRLGI